MRRAGGYAYTANADGWGSIREQDTFTCIHCCRVTFLKAGVEPEHRCRSCYGYICEQCASKPCLPLEEQLRMMESPSYRRRRIFKIGR